MTKQERYDHVLGYFQEHVPIAETELHYSNPYELIVAVALSAHRPRSRRDHSAAERPAGPRWLHDHDACRVSHHTTKKYTHKHCAATRRTPRATPAAAPAPRHALLR